jgi:hypothetical protein
MGEEFSFRLEKSSFASADPGENPRTKETARRAFVAALVVGGVVVFGLALWELRVVIALLFFAFIIAAAMRPGVEWLRRYRIPRGVGILLHYTALVAAIGLLIWFVVPSAIAQIPGSRPDDVRAPRGGARILRDQAARAPRPRAVIGPLTAGAVAVGVGFTESWQTALYAGVILFAAKEAETSER